MFNRMQEFLVTGEVEPRIPYLMPFAKGASGGKSNDDDSDDDDDDSDDDDDDSDDDDEEDDPDAEKSDEEIREELKKIRGSLKRANEQSARRRRREKDRRAREEADRKKKPAAKKEDEDGDSDVDARISEAESRGITRAKKAEAKSALLAAGVSPERVTKAVGLVDLDDLDLDDDGLEGIEAAIEDLRDSWPELFVKKRTRRQSVAGEGDRDGKEGGRRKAMTPSERQAAVATGRSRR